MKDSVIYRTYSNFVDTNAIGNVGDERRYIVCIANAVIFASLVSNEQIVSSDIVVEYANRLAVFLGLKTSLLNLKMLSCKKQLQKFCEDVNKWNLTKENANDMLHVLFEKYINKKETGAYYTDNQTTRYIANKAVLTYLFDGVFLDVDFCSLLNNSLWVLEKLKTLTVEEKKQVLDRLYDISILDPTCGTGAFLFGALEELLEMYQPVRLKFAKETAHRTDAV